MRRRESQTSPVGKIQQKHNFPGLGILFWRPLCAKLGLGAGTLSQVRRCPCTSGGSRRQWDVSMQLDTNMADELRAVWATQEQDKACPGLTAELRKASHKGSLSQDVRDVW